MIKSNLAIRLIDMNNFSIEKEVDFRINDEIFEELNSQIKFFEERGMEFAITSIKIRDTTKFYMWVIERLFPEFIIEDHQGDKQGIPDFRIQKMTWEEFQKKSFNCDRKEIEHFDGRRAFYKEKFDNMPSEIFIEVKRNSDGLHHTQFNWILQNRDKKVIKLLFIKEDNPHGY